MDCDRIATMQDIVRAFRHRRRCAPLLAANLTELSRALTEQHRWSEAFEASDDGRDLYYALFQQQPRAFRRFPVVENGRLVGGITRFDILRAIRDVRK